MPDTGPSRLISLNIPSVLDLRYGQVDATFQAMVDDPDGITQLVVYYDRPLTTSLGSYPFQVIHGNADDWSDGFNSYVSKVLPFNAAGPVNITNVALTDAYGNIMNFSTAELFELGVDTSFEVYSNDADVSAPTLNELVIPKIVDVRNGNSFAEFSAAASDNSGIDEITIWFDRDLKVTYSDEVNSVFYDFGLVGLYGYSDDWSDNRSTDQLQFSKLNQTGSTDIDRVVVSDIYGNDRTYTNAELRALGFNTSFAIVGADPVRPTSYASNLPNSINIREGQSLNVPLVLNGLTTSYVSYQYDISTLGGTASGLDIGLATQSGSVFVSSITPTTETESIIISAARDGIEEENETAYLTVRLSGDLSFADGGRLAVVKINIIDDNLSTGGAGNDTLYGTLAAESLAGGNGDDLYFLNAGDKVIEGLNGGIDTVFTSTSYTLAVNVENLTLTGSAHLNGTGNAQANFLVGNAGNNVLNGMAGADTIQGGGGNDTYIVDQIGDRVIEGLNGGTDSVYASTSYSLAANVENLSLTGKAHLNGVGNWQANLLIGNAGNNVLNGMAGADTIQGGGGNDRLFGGRGKDVLIGGGGNDTYSVDHLGDRVIEGLNRGIDTIYASTSYTLAANVENLSLTGKAHLNGVGNWQANLLIGNDGNNVLNGMAGADTIQGGGGNDRLFGGGSADVLFGGKGKDTLTGGVGEDIFVFQSGDTGTANTSRDIITDFEKGDRIDLRAYDANIETLRDDAFTFMGTSSVENGIWYERSGRSLLVLGDVDGDGRADFSILVGDTNSVSRGDFLL